MEESIFLEGYFLRALGRGEPKNGDWIKGSRSFVRVGAKPRFKTTIYELEEIKKEDRIIMVKVSKVFGADKIIC